MAAAMTPESFQDAMAVSRETRERLEAYLALLQRWQPRINLVGRSTLEDPWRRHFLDSAQLFAYLSPDCKTVIDLGSGAGFPGLVLSILGVPEVHLVESDARKVAFLREAARVTESAITLHSTRIESLNPFFCHAVTARALAPLDQLVDYAYKFIEDRGECLFLKGRDVNQELTDSVKRRIVRLDRFPSRSDQLGSILRFRLRKVTDHEHPSLLEPSGGGG